MSEKLKLVWFAWQPTPYNDFLFRNLGRDPDVDLLVYYRFGGKATHPWQDPMRSGYVSKLYNGKGLSVDGHILAGALRDKSLWVTAGWPGLTMKGAIAILAMRRRRFVFWTDTPQVQGKGAGGRSTVVEYVADGKPYRPVHAQLRRMLYRVVFNRAGVVMATGAPGVDALKVLGCPPSKLVNFPFIVDLPDLSMRKRLLEGNGSGPIRFFASGQLVMRKGYDLAVEALRILKSRTARQIELVLAGDGEERARLEAQCQESGITDEVKLLGWQEPKAVQELLLSSHAFVHPARYDPFPVAVLEAMGSGVAVLGSDAAGSVVDRVKHGSNGLIHKKGDAATLAAHMLQVAENPKLAISMGEAARLKAQEWPVNRAIDILKEVYHRCIGHP